MPHIIQRKSFGLMGIASVQADVQRGEVAGQIPKEPTTEIIGVAWAARGLKPNSYHLADRAFVVV